MKEPTFNALLRYDAIAAEEYLSDDNPIHNEAVLAWATLKNLKRANTSFKMAMAWIEEQGKQDAYLMTYNNTDHLTGKGEIVVVLNDRDTAIMLKLALG